MKIKQNFQRMMAMKCFFFYKKQTNKKATKINKANKKQKTLLSNLSRLALDWDGRTTKRVVLPVHT